MSGFLSRWSQRKLAEKEGEAPPPEPAPPEPEAAAPVVEAEAAPPEPVAEEPEPEFDLASLPSLDSLHAGSDFTAFLKKGVPLALRQAALRKAWVTDPLIRDFRNPLDYGWDFNTPGGLPAGFSDTLGEAADVVRKLLRQAVGEKEPAEEGQEPATAPEPVAEPEAPLLVAEAPAEAEPAAMEPVPEFAPPRRRHGGALPS